MKCTRCGKAVDYYYLAGPVVLCEECACNGVATLADEGLFPFIDNVVTANVTPDDSIEKMKKKADLNSAYGMALKAVLGSGNDAATGENAPDKYLAQKAVLSSAYGMKAKPDDATLDAVYTPEEKAELMEKMKYRDTEKNYPDFGDTSIPLEGREQYFDTDKAKPENEDMA